MRVVKRHGEDWVVTQVKRGWRAECVEHDLTVRAETEALLMGEIDELAALLLLV